MELLALTATGAEWSFIWMVTILGFCLVLLLLFVFVYIMKGLGWIMQPKKSASVKADEGTKAAIATSLALSKDEDELAAVAMALDLYYNSLHDMENPHLTVHQHATAWHAIH